MKYWEIIADNLSKAGWSWGCVSAADSRGQTISIARIIDRHEIDGTGRQTTPGASINQPSLRVIGIDHRSPIFESAEHVDAGIRPAYVQRLLIGGNLGWRRRNWLLTFGLERFI